MRTGWCVCCKLPQVQEHQKQRQETLTVVLRTCVAVYQQLNIGLAENVSGVAGICPGAARRPSAVQCPRVVANRAPRPILGGLLKALEQPA